MAPDPEGKSSYTHIIALNYFSLFFLAGGIGAALLLGESPLASFSLFALWLYLLPPLLCRLTILVAGRPRGIVSPSSRTHTLWWWLFQLQLPFNRFPFLEELLRSVPGLYALWLNLWGARVSTMAFWSPGVTVMERYHLEIGRGVILGTQVFLSGHVIKKLPDGSTLLIVDAIRLDEGALVGARATLSPGCQVAPHQGVPFNALLRPYTALRDGRKIALRPRSDCEQPQQ